MKMKHLAILSLCLFAAVSMNAQRLSTRTGMVKFYSEAPLENIEAVNNQVSSIINPETADFAFLVPIKGFVFEKALMQEHFNERYLESDKFPTGTFKGKVEDLEKVDLKKDGKYEVAFSGTMTIHGVEKGLSEKAVITVKDGKMHLDSKFYLNPEDYGVKIPASKKENISDKLEITVKIEYDN